MYRYVNLHGYIHIYIYTALRGEGGSSSPFIRRQRAIHHSLTTSSCESSWADRLATLHIRESSWQESPVLGKVREQFADLEQSSLRNDNFLGARSLFRKRWTTAVYCCTLCRTTVVFRPAVLCIANSHGAQPLGLLDQLVNLLKLTSTVIILSATGHHRIST